MMSEMEKIIEATSYLSTRMGETPRFGIILGSGLGLLADQVEAKTAIDFQVIPHFPKSTVQGHRGRLVVGILNEIPVMVLEGRLHYYEGYSMDQVVFPLRCMLYLGVVNLIVTNAAGSVHADYKPCELMLIKDHIKFCADSPLRGTNLDAFGLRFNDMSDPYTREIRDLAKECGKELGIPLKEGVYFYMPGPSYETPSEVKAINILGGHVVGMSTVPEVLVASHGGMKVLGLTCITNMGTGIGKQVVGHDDVIKTGEQMAEKFISLLHLILGRWNELQDQS